MRALDDALRGHGAAIAVVGPAGIGKSHLVSRFLEDARGSATVLVGRCLSYGAGITYWPVVQVLRQIVGADVGSEQAADTLRDILGADEDARLAVRRLVPLLGTSGEPGSAEETAWSVQLLLGRLAADHPVVVVLDDLHWAESALLELIAQLIASTADTALMVVAQARPELFDRWTIPDGMARTVLAPMTNSEASTLLTRHLGPELPTTVVEAITGRAEGNPLYVEEIGRHLVEHGLVQRVSDGWQVKGDVSAMPIPPSLEALLASRLDQLPAMERSLLGRVSVIGLQFDSADVATVAGDLGKPASLDRALASLVRRDLLRRADDTATSGSASPWTFRHVLVRDAVYESSRNSCAPTSTSVSPAAWPATAWELARSTPLWVTTSNKLSAGVGISGSVARRWKHWLRGPRTPSVRPRIPLGISTTSGRRRPGWSVPPLQHRSASTTGRTCCGAGLTCSVPNPATTKLSHCWIRSSQH